MGSEGAPRLYTTAEVADAWGVATKTVLRWVDLGQVAAIRTPSGHLRFREDVLPPLEGVS